MASIQDIEAELEILKAQEQAIKERMRALMRDRNKAILQDQCDHWGLTVEEYLQAKATASPHRAIEHQLDQVAIALGKLSAADPQRQALETQQYLLQQQLQEALARKRPLGVVLNEARKAKAKAAREVQTVQVIPAQVAAIAKGV